MPTLDRPRVSLVTFTYNDASLAGELLAGVPGWSVRPDEVIVVDDGSAPPFTPPVTNPPTRVVRFDANQGITRAKHAGVSAATGDVVLALDCDTRLSPDWLAVCLERLAEPGVAMVSGPVVHGAGTDLVSRYLRAFGDNHNLGADGEVPFIPGNAWLIRAEAWRQAGGMAGHDRAVCEDHYLCHRLRELGWKLMADPRAVAVQTRRISRPALARRIWTWCGWAFKENLPAPPDMPAFAFAHLTRPMAERLEAAVNMGEPLFVYLELFYWSYCLADLLAHGERALGYPPELRASLWGGLRAFLGARPRLFRLFRADLAQAGQTPPPGVSRAGEGGIWGDSLDIFAALSGSGIWGWLDGPGAERMLAEDRTVERHFSFYAESAPGVAGPR